MLIDKKDLEAGKELVDSLMKDIKSKDYFVPEDKYEAYIVGGLDFQFSEGVLSEYQYTVLLGATLGEERANERIEKMKNGVKTRKRKG